VIVTAAKIVGNNSDGDFVSGYEWCIEQVRNSSYLELASGLEIQKAIAYLRENNFPKVRIDNQKIYKNDSFRQLQH
jgi:intraflagellar transport protein 88